MTSVLMIFLWANIGWFGSGERGFNFTFPAFNALINFLFWRSLFSTSSLRRFAAESSDFFILFSRSLSARSRAFFMALAFMGA